MVSSVSRRALQEGRATGQRLPRPTRQALPSRPARTYWPEKGSTSCTVLVEGIVSYCRLAAVGLPSVTEKSKINGGINNWFDSPIIRISMLVTRSSNWYASVVITCA